MKLTCDEATTICDKSQYGAATFWEKIKLNIHVFLCKKCGLYSKQNGIMSKCYEKHRNNIKQEEKSLCDNEKEIMAKEILEKL